MNKYQNLSKEQLLQIVEKQEKELKNKKYGLVWDSEREPEQVVLDCENNLPVLKRVKGKEVRTNDEEDNILIEGDNYHALTVLNYTHKGKIDVIYIDPPYNTGKANEWRYNDKYVDRADGYRHSKWLNFISKRMKIAKELLRNTGLIFISIDNNEAYQLKLLMDNIFSEDQFIGNIIIKSNPRGSQEPVGISTEHEYLLCYSRSKEAVNNLVGDERNKDDDEFDFIYNNRKARTLGLRKRGGDWRRQDRPNMYYPFFVNPSTLKVSLEQTKGFSEIVYPIRPDGEESRWTWGIDTSKKDIDLLIAKEIKRKNEKVYDIYRLDYLEDEEGTRKTEKVKSIWTFKELNYQHARQYFKRMFNDSDKFDFPKSPEMILQILKSLSFKSGIILDFFAGSGTTGHAVLELNKEDGGNRKFILCTNNENNICRDVTYPRIEKVINGYDFKGKDKTTLFEKKITWTDFSKKAEEINEQINNLIEENTDKFDKIEKKIEDGILKVTGIKNIDGKKEGLSGNLQYFKTSFVKKTNNRDQVKLNLTRKCTEMLCVKENIFNEEKAEEDFKIFSSNKKDKFLCVYYNFIDDSFEQFIAELKKLKGKKNIYMFSLENKIEKSLFKGINNFTLEPIPQKILDVYKQLVKMNIPEKKEIIFIELGKANKKIFEENEKDEGARILRIVLEKTIQKIAQNSGINTLNEKGKEEKISTLNDSLKANKTFSQIIWEENKTCLTIGNHAAHGEYDEYEIKQVKHFYKHVQSLLDNFI